MSRCSPLTLPLLLLAGALPSCTAARSTYHLAKAEQAVYLAREAEAPDRVVYEWTMADEFIRKAREEWGYSDYGPAEDYSKKATEWAGKAEERARELQRSKALDSSPDVVPEELDKQPDTEQPAIQGREDKLVVPDDTDEEE